MDASKTALLFGPYQPPALRIGDRVCCQVRDCFLVVTSWTDAPLSWPRGCLDQRSPGFPSIIVDDELARAITQESAASISYWWGVSSPTVAKWRKALAVTRRNNQGSQVLIHLATGKAREVSRRNGMTEQGRQKQRENASRRRLWELAPQAQRGIPWAPEHVALLGTVPDREVMALTGHSLDAIASKRQRLRISAYGNSEHSSHG